VLAPLAWQSGGPNFAANLDSCAETGYAMGYLCTSGDDSNMSKVVYRSCPMPPGIARNHFIIFEVSASQRGEPNGAMC